MIGLSWVLGLLITGWGQINVIDNLISIAVGEGYDPHQEKRHRKTCWQTTTKSYSSPLLSTIWLLCMYTHITHILLRKTSSIKEME